MCSGIPVAAVTVTLNAGAPTGSIIGDELVQGLDCGRVIDLVGVAIVNTGGIPLSDFVIRIQRGSERPYQRVPYSQATAGTVYPVMIRGIGGRADIRFTSEVDEPNQTTTTLTCILYARESTT